MGLREGFFFLFVLVISWTYADSENLIGNMPLDYKTPSDMKNSGSVDRNENLCSVCEDFTARATYYLGENKTKDEIIDTLHQACSELHSYEQQCVVLVDYYASLFFVEINKIHPEEFCRKVNLCERTKVLHLPKEEDTCTLCHRTVEEVLAKLKDPDTEFGIIQALLKECKKMGNYVKECKRLVFQYGPLILANGEKFFEKTDVCVSIHACHASQMPIGISSIADASLSDA